MRFSLNYFTKMLRETLWLRRFPLKQPKLMAPDPVDDNMKRQWTSMKKRTPSSRRAITPIVGGTIFIIILLISTGLIFWNASLYDSYLQDINNSELMYHQQVSENIAVTGFKFTNNVLNINITNFGPITVRIVRMWLTDISADWHKSFNLNYYVTPARTISVGGQPFGSLNANDLYTVKFITSRGNIFGDTNFANNPIVGIAQGMGWVTIIWNSYVFRDNNNQVWRPAWNISNSGNELEFNITVVNHSNYNLTLLRYTYLRLEVSTGATGNAYPYYIMSPGTTFSQPVCYTQGGQPPIVIPANKTGDISTGGKPVMIPFMDVVFYKGGQCNVPANKPQAASYYSVYIVLYYQFKTCPTCQTLTQAQTIPFEGTALY
jgi:hypothetical protein